ncbi:MAG: hypothetical protein ACI3W5_16565 [Faecousia sp.]
MRRFSIVVTCLFLVLGMMAVPTYASGFSDSIVISQSVTKVDDDSYYLETISIPAIQSYSNTKRGTKTAAYVASGTTIYSISVTGTFNYDGTSSEAISASGTITTYVDGVSINNRYAYTSGASAYAFGSVSYNGVTLQKTVTLTCDKDGNLS